MEAGELALALADCFAYAARRMREASRTSPQRAGPPMRAAVRIMEAVRYVLAEHGRDGLATSDVARLLREAQRVGAVVLVSRAKNLDVLVGATLAQMMRSGRVSKGRDGRWRMADIA